MEKSIQEGTKKATSLSFGQTLYLLALNLRETQKILRQNENPVSTEIVPDHKKTIKQVLVLVRESDELVDALFERLLTDGYDGVLSEALEKMKN